tara:strand:- start:4524 stop:4757 length:234 start_codon:yes stop_codon:yes gene_type:complete
MKRIVDELPPGTQKLKLSKSITRKDIKQFFDNVHRTFVLTAVSWDAITGFATLEFTPGNGVLWADTHEPLEVTDGDW